MGQGLQPDQAQLGAPGKHACTDCTKTACTQLSAMPRMEHCQAGACCQESAHGQVAERGLKFVQGFARLLAMRQATGQLPVMYREAWSFSACMTLAGTAAHMAPPAPHPRCAPHGVQRHDPPQLDRQLAHPQVRCGAPTFSALTLQPQRRLCCGTPRGPALSWCRLRPGCCSSCRVTSGQPGGLAVRVTCLQVLAAHGLQRPGLPRGLAAGLCACEMPGWSDAQWLQAVHIRVHAEGPYGGQPGGHQ